MRSRSVVGKRPRHERRSSAPGRAAGAALLLLLLLVAGGCAHRGAALARPAPESLPPGSPLRDRSMDDGDAWLRHHLMFAEYDRALTLLERRSAAPDDRLWRALQRGLVLHQAGEFAASNAAFEWAEVEADLRYTRSLSRGAASLLVNDRMLAFTPSRAELAMIPYYRMLNYLGTGEMEGAAVEARKANALLNRLERRDDARCHEDAMVRYLAGLVLAAAGDRNDALVSLRLAEQAFDGCSGAGVRVPGAIGSDLVRVSRSLGISEVADSAAARYAVEVLPAAGGELVLLLEHGFVAHRVEQAIHVPIFPQDLEGLSGDDEGGVLEAAGVIAARLLDGAVQRAHWGSSLYDHPAVQVAQALEGAYVLRLAWPVARRGEAPPQLRVFVNDSPATVTTVGDLSTLSEQELEGRQLAVLSRMVARGLTKYLVSREAERRAERKGGELAGFLVGRLTNLAANELERADTRSWSLLPDQVSMVRAHLPPGEHHLRVEVLDSRGALLQERDLGTVRIGAGELVMRSERVW
jgi:uncharacterized protein